MMTRLPPPEQWALVKMTEIELAEEIERHVDYVNEHGDSVHLPMSFVRHYHNRDDGALPTIVAIATAPIILADGVILAKEDGIDVERGIDFVIPEEVMALLPRRADCTPEVIAEAMRFLTDEWLCDVLTDYAGKCVLISAALTIIERSLLDQRPAFFVTAGRRGSGKTTTLTMLILAVTGIWPAAAAWSTNEEERRKAILGYFLHGASYIIWDNVKRGSQIACPHIEKSCTAAYYADRRLGVSEIVSTSAATIHLFTGNNIGPKGDLASRSLSVRLEVERPDPENRQYRHPDPIGWTENHRVEILKALYTILLGNPTLDEPADAEMKTRYKTWWRLVGSAVENAAKEAGHGEVDFTALFHRQDDEDEDDVTLADVLARMKAKWSETFKASDVAEQINLVLQVDNPLRDALREFLYPALAPAQRVTPRSVGMKLKQHVGEAVRRGDVVLILKAVADRPADGTRHGTGAYRIEVTGNQNEIVTVSGSLIDHAANVSADDVLGPAPSDDEVLGRKAKT
jgi:hypothetical protein